MLILDLGIFHRKVHVISIKESIIWTLVWISLALIFNFIIYQWQGSEKALQFLTGYLIEKALSIDNIFVMVLIFQYFQIPAKSQHQVLFWGILGALIMRAIFIFVGVELLEHFHWTIYIFGIILLYSGIKLLIQKETKVDPEKNPIIKLVTKIVPVSRDLNATKFIIFINGKRHITNLFLVLIFIETTDLIFAIDSIPAILSITTDRFIVYTSNAFAILGLRSLYFSLAGLMTVFRYLHYGLSAILIFVGCKMLLTDIFEINTVIALLIVVAILATSMIASVLIKSEK